MPAAVAVPIATAVIAAGATVYSVNAQQEAAKKARAEQEKLAAMNKPPELPNTAALTGSIQKGQQLAQSAGGTILSDQNKNQAPPIGSAQTTGQKQLLGT